MNHVYFVTATDTEAGKTFCSAALLQAAAQAGRRCVGFKPVASEADAAGHNADVLALQAASALRLPYAAHNCYTFAEATAPHLAAADAGQTIDGARMSAALQALRVQSDWVVVEGAGGWLTPLGDAADFADWVAAEKLPVILVVGMKLGCINHALLTAAAIAQADLPLAGWIANCVSPSPHRLTDYVATLQQRLDAPLLGVMPYAPDAAADYLDIAPLL